MLFKLRPLLIKPLTEHLGFCRIFRCLNQTQWVARSYAQAFRAKAKGAQSRLLSQAALITQDESALRHNSFSLSNICFGLQPLHQFAGQPMHLKLVARSTVTSGTKQSKVVCLEVWKKSATLLGGWDNDACFLQHV